MNKLFKPVKKQKEHVWKSDTIFRCLRLPLMLKQFF